MNLNQETKKQIHTKIYESCIRKIDAYTEDISEKEKEILNLILKVEIAKKELISLKNSKTIFLKELNIQKKLIESVEKDKSPKINEEKKENTTKKEENTTKKEENTTKKEELDGNNSQKIVPIPVALTHTPKNSKNYLDEVNNEKIKYYHDDKGYDAKFIKIGAHFYSRENNSKGFIFRGLVSYISTTLTDESNNRKFCYIKLDKNGKSKVGDLKPGDSVPNISPGGRGSTKYMRDAANFSGITPLKNGYFRGIIH